MRRVLALSLGMLGLLGISGWLMDAMAASVTQSSPNANGVQKQAPQARQGQASRSRGAGSAPLHKLEIEVGHSHVVKVPSARQVAVGDSQTLQANAMSATEIVFFGKHAGTTTVDVWDKKGHRHRYKVTVHTAGRLQKLGMLRELLSGIAHLQVVTEGEHVILKGDGIAALDRQIIDQVLGRFPDVIDMTEKESADPMILLDVLVIELPRSKLGELGLNWSASDTSRLHLGGQWGLGRSGLDTGVSNAVAATTGWLVAQADVASKLQLLTQRGEAVLLAQPKLIAKTGTTASFLAGGEVPYATTDSKGRTHTEFKKYGVALSMKPSLARHGRIVADVEVEVSAVDPTINTPAGPAMRVRKTNTQIEALSGQSVVLAGFLSSERSTQYQGLPSTQVGFFEALGGKRSQHERQTELAILVTPMIVGANAWNLQDRARRARLYSDLAVTGGTRLENREGAIAPLLMQDALDTRQSKQDEVSNYSIWEQFQPAVIPQQWLAPQVLSQPMQATHD